LHIIVSGAQEAKRRPWRRKEQRAKFKKREPSGKDRRQVETCKNSLYRQQGGKGCRCDYPQHGQLRRKSRRKDIDVGAVRFRPHVAPDQKGKGGKSERKKGAIRPQPEKRKKITR